MSEMKDANWSRIQFAILRYVACYGYGERVLKIQIIVGAGGRFCLILAVGQLPVKPVHCEV